MSLLFGTSCRGDILYIVRLVVALTAVLLPATAAAQPMAMVVSKLEAPKPELRLLDDDGLRLENGESIGHATERRHRPHKWLSHTVRHLDLQLKHAEAGLGFGFDVKKRHATLTIGKSAQGFGLDTRVKFHEGKAFA